MLVIADSQSLNVKRDLRLDHLATNVLNSRDVAGVVPVEVLLEGLYVGLVDTIQDALDDVRMLGFAPGGSADTQLLCS